MADFFSLKSQLRYGAATALIASLSGFSGAAYAQDETCDTDANGECVEEVVVTGSRIARAGIDTVEPAIVLDAELLNKRGFTNIADLLNEAPAFGAPAASPTGTQTGSVIGQNVVDFLGLGSQRTLTLVNGRRFVSSNPPTTFGINGGLQVDFNVIPTALVDRIETIATGGAPIYGSDAIAGTINVILKDDYEGFEVSGQYGEYKAGDGKQYRIQTVMGGNFADDRGNATLSLEFFEQGGIFGGRRPLFGQNEPFVSEVPDVQDVDGDGEVDAVFQIFNANGTDGQSTVQLFTQNGIIAPTNFLIPSAGAGALADGNFYEFNQSSGLDIFTPGQGIPGTSAFFAQGGDGMDFFDVVDQLRSPVERIVVSGTAHYDFTDNIRAFTEFTFANSEAAELSNQGGFQTFAFSDTSEGVRFSVDNPFLSDQARQVLTDNGLEEFYLHRFLNDILENGEQRTENFVWRAVGGLEGDFEFADRGFSWDISANFGQSDVDTSSFGINDLRYLNALDAVAVTQEDIDNNDFSGLNIVRDNQTITIGGGNAIQAGDIICKSVLDTLTGDQEPPSGNGLQLASDPFVEGCVPLNLFGEGAATAEAIDFILASSSSAAEMQQRVFSANLQGELFNLPAGMVQFGIGYENRKEKGAFTPSGITQLGLTRSSAQDPTAGQFKTDEFYAEVFVPVLKDGDIPFINHLTFEPKYRYIDNSLAGGDSTYTLGGSMGIADVVTLRGNFTRAIRSPSIVELFAPKVQTFDTVDDPCDRTNIDEGPNPDVRRANCIADGITDPDNFASNARNATIIGQTSGNPDLLNETADSWSIGAVIEPRDLVPGLVFTVDYMNIKIDNRITDIEATDFAEACYDSVSFPSSACSNITRDASGQIITFSSGQANAATSAYEGVSIDARYDFQMSDFIGLFNKDSKGKDWGEIDLRANLFRNIKNDVSVVGEAPINEIGEFGQNKWSGTYDVTYTYDKLQAFWRIAWQDSALLDAADNPSYFADQDGNIITKTGDRFLHNASVSYEVVDGVQFRVAVDNVFNRRGNLLQRAYNDIGFAERLGRNYRFNIRASF